MNNGKTIGMVLFLGGIILLMVYGIILGFEKILAAGDFISGILIVMVFIGFFTLMISIYIEQKKNTKKTMNNITKEELEP